MNFDDYMRRVRRRSTPRDKGDFVVELCRERSVLDIGCIDHTVETARGLGDRWLHGRIAAAAREAIGLDREAAAAAELTTAGYAIEIGDAQQFQLGRTFDVIVAGDVIEHLSNVGGFLDSARSHMTTASLLVVTTPNPFNVDQALRILQGLDVGVNPQHVSWIDPIVMYQLLERHGLVVTDFSWIVTDYPQLRRRQLRWLADAAMRVRPLWQRDFAVVAQLAGPLEPG